MEQDLLLQSIGITGIVIFYVVLAKLSERMGKGLMLPHYYLWYYVSCIITLLIIPAHTYLHLRYELPHSLELIDQQALYFTMLLLSNVIAILVSIKYWWWLKDEIFKKLKSNC